MDETTRNYTLAGIGALALIFVIDDRVKPLGLSKFNPITLLRRKLYPPPPQPFPQQQTRAANPMLAAAVPVQAAPRIDPAFLQRIATTSASKIAQQSNISRYLNMR